MDLESLAFPGLNKTRERLLDVLSRLTFPRALKYLDIGPGLLEEAQRNLTLRDGARRARARGLHRRAVRAPRARLAGRTRTC